MKGKVLVLDDEHNVLYAIGKVLERAGFEPICVDNPADALQRAEESDTAVIDIKLGDFSGIDVLKNLREKGITIPVIMITAYTSPENVIKATKFGAVEILKKPFDLKDLLNSVEKVIPRKRKKTIPKEINGFPIVGSSPKMLEVFKMIGLASSNDMNVLITGETGTGKEVIARAIHENSERSGNPFIAINCSAIPKHLLEAELFGYTKGSFTGALKDTPGKVELANKGTLFLDEIGDMPQELQTKLLRFLEEKKFYRIGDTKETHVNVRIIAATNRNLENLIEEGGFRADLYFRLAQITINVPPLRERKEDIPELISFFISKANGELGTEVEGIEEDALEKAMQYPWPGNVRELKNVVYRSVLETKKGYIKHLPISLNQLPNQSLEDILREYIKSVPEEEIGNIPSVFEQALLKILMERYGDNKSKIANVLNISRNTLRAKIRQYFGKEGDEKGHSNTRKT